MKIKYDNLADAMYMRYSTNKVESTKLVNDSVIDFDSQGGVVGIEIIGVKQQFKNNNIELKTGIKSIEYA